MWWRRSITWANVTFELSGQSINAINIRGIIIFFFLTPLWSCPPLLFWQACTKWNNITFVTVVPYISEWFCKPEPQLRNKLSYLIWIRPVVSIVYPYLFYLSATCQNWTLAFLKHFFCFFMPEHDVEITSNPYRITHICSYVNHNSFSGSRIIKNFVFVITQVVIQKIACVIESSFNDIPVCF